MRTQFFQCDMCGSEIRGQIAVFLFNDTMLTNQFQNVPVQKQADFCQLCAEKIKIAIDTMGEEAKAEDQKITE